jgi:hypothetical protein
VVLIVEVMTLSIHPVTVVGTVVIGLVNISETQLVLPLIIVLVAMIPDVVAVIFLVISLILITVSVIVILCTDASSAVVMVVFSWPCPYCNVHDPVFHGSVPKDPNLAVI